MQTLLPVDIIFFSKIWSYLTGFKSVFERDKEIEKVS